MLTSSKLIIELNSMEYNCKHSKRVRRRTHRHNEIQKNNYANILFYKKAFTKQQNIVKIKTSKIDNILTKRCRPCDLAKF